MYVPKEIEKYLVRDEIVEKEFTLKKRFAFRGYTVYATNKRLFIMQGNTVRDYDYSHISSIEITQERYWAGVVIGFLILVLSVVILWKGSVVFSSINEIIGWALAVFGGAILVLGLTRTQHIRLNIVGITYPQKLSGHLSELESLFKLIREKRT